MRVDEQKSLVSNNIFHVMKLYVSVSRSTKWLVIRTRPETEEGEVNIDRPSLSSELGNSAWRLQPLDNGTEVRNLVCFKLSLIKI